jgi:hypothetical protein
MSRFSLALLGAATGVILAGCGGGGGGGGTTNPAVTQNVTGFVWDADTAGPVAGAAVKVQGTNIQATTNAQGEYTVGPLNPTRAYNLQVDKTGYVENWVKILSKNATLQSPQVILTAGNPAVAITGTTGGNVDSNPTLEGSSARASIPANALPGGAATAQASLTLIAGTGIPSAPTGTMASQVAYPVVNFGLSGATGSFTQPVTLTFPLPFQMTAGATIPVLKLALDGTWAPLAVTQQTGAQATVDTGGKTASFQTGQTGTFSLSLPLNATAQLTSSQRQAIQGPYTGPVEVPLTGATINWSVTGADARDALDSTFVQNQRQGDILYAGDLDATKIVVNPRGTSLINVVHNDLSVSVTSSGFQIAQTGGTANGTVQGLATVEIVPHQQGSGGAN